jgi:hypothetical protein
MFVLFIILVFMIVGGWMIMLNGIVNLENRIRKLEEAKKEPTHE